MKSSAFAKILESYATKTLLSSSQGWSALARMFHLAKSKTVQVFTRELIELAQRVPSGENNLGQLADEIAPMQGMAIALGKAPIADALNEVAQLVSQCAATDAAALEAHLSEQMQAPQTKPGRKQAPARDASIVPSYERRLEEALGDEVGFAELIAQLEADRRLNAADFKQLAKAFSGRSGKSKVEALEAIKARHRNLMDARAKQRFNAGRTAA